jgi:hypothetical protein
VYNFLQSSKSKGTFDMAEQLKQPSMAEEGKISGARALAIAHEWIDTWNSGDLEQNLSLYADDCEMLSPFIVPIAQEPSGVLKGRATVGAYFRKLWDRGPNVRLELVTGDRGAFTAAGRQDFESARSLSNRNLTHLGSGLTSSENRAALTPMLPFKRRSGWNIHFAARQVFARICDMLLGARSFDPTSD